MKQYYILFLTLALALCHDYKALAQPVANPDTIGVCNNDSYIINLLANDEGPGIEFDNILVEPDFGNLESDGSGLILYTPDSSFTGTDAFIYSIVDGDEILDITTVIVYVQDYTDCVWPGDANNDLVANNLDLLNIGLYYGNEGPERFETDSEWDNDYCDNWNEDFDLADYAPQKFADCNGDGVVDVSDTLPILLNYGETHDKGDEIAGGDEAPPLYIDFFTDTIYAGSAVSLPLILGSAEYPASNIYGLAFTIAGGDGLIVPGSLRVQFNSGWLGEPGADLISINYYDSSSASYDAAVTRVTHVPVSGYGSIGTVEFVMEDDLAGKVQDISAMLLLCITPTGLKAVNDYGGALEINPACDSVIVYKVETGIYNVPVNDIKIYPNPVQHFCNIQLPETVSGNVIVKNMFGETVMSVSIENTKTYILNTSQLNPGTYSLEILTGTMIYLQKIVIQ